MRGRLSRLFFPVCCPVCGSRDFPESVEEKGCCPSCSVKYLYSPEKALITNPEFAPECFQILCASYYAESFRDAMVKYKFSGEISYGRHFGKMIYFTGKKAGIFSGVDLITAVPVSDEKFRERGFNQAEEIAGTVAKESGLPFMMLLKRDYQGEAQSALLADSRERIEEKFSVTEENREMLKGKSVLLIDDILTTGATISGCARLIKSMGAAMVIGAAVTGGRREFQ